MPQQSVKTKALADEGMIQDVLIEIHELIPTKDRWCREYHAASGSGRPRSPLSKDAVRFSLRGALEKAISILDLTAKDRLKVEQYLIKSFGGQINMINLYSEHQFIVDRIKFLIDQLQNERNSNG